MPCDGLILTGLFAALLFLVDLDAELGDQHSDRLRRGSYGVSLYVNLDTQRGVRAVLFLVAMMSLSIFAYRRREFKSVLRLAGIALAANVVHAVIENLSPAKADGTVIEYLSLESHARVPSIEQREAYYMGGWARNRSELLAHLNRTSLLPSTARKLLCADKEVHFHKTTIASLRKILKSSCWRHTNFTGVRDPPRCTGPVRGMDVYVRDALSFYDLSLPGGAPEQSAIWLMGDTGNGPFRSSQTSFPVIMKARAALTGEQKDRMILSPILWRLNNGRHFDWAVNPALYHQTAWDDKKDVLVWRGGSTGHRYSVLRSLLPSLKGRSDVDIGFSELAQKCSSDRGCPGSREMLKKRKTREEILKNKYLLVLPGNDVSSGLKWMMYSNSVVFMSAPKVVSWAMEDWLEPYVHYVPLADNYSDVSSQLDWAKAHQDDVQNISKEATHFMHHLFVSKRARENDERVRQLMVRRYHSLFAEELQTFCNNDTADARWRM